MEYRPNELEGKWQQYWQENQTFKADFPSDKPKYYVLDMFPYPSGAGLHVGHPLGYIASDIYARYKRLQGFNVLHPIGYDSFGLPAEQYAIETGQHPAVTTQTNIKGGTDKQGKEIKGYEHQLKHLGFSFDWDREFRTSDPEYYRWTQWIFIQLFDSYYDKNADQAVAIGELIETFEKDGNKNIHAETSYEHTFTAEEWNSFTESQKSDILLQYRLTYLAEAEVNWCPDLGTVLANDEVINGVSERGGYPVIRKKMTQWMMRITAYSERLLQGLEQVNWPEATKEQQRNWIGKSSGAELTFKVLPPTPSKGGGAIQHYLTADPAMAKKLLENAKEMRKNPTQAEDALWQVLRNRNLSDKFRRQHPIDQFIVDFVCLNKNLIIQVDGEYHNAERQFELDKERQHILEDLGYSVLRFTNEEVLNNPEQVIHSISETLGQLEAEKVPLSFGEGLGVRIFTTRPDTIFGVSFLTLAPEHPLVAKITTEEYKEAVETYISETAKKSERERMADVKTISGQFTGAYAEHPFTHQPIPIWIGDYVLASYGTGAVMAVPAGDERDYAFAKHFDLPIPNIFDQDISENAFSGKEGFTLQNSDFLEGLNYEKATQEVISVMEERGIGKEKINYRLRDAVFSRQRYWGEPVPIYFKNGVPNPLPDSALPLKLPNVDEYLPTQTGEPPLGRAKNWAWNEKEEKVVSVEKIDEKTVFPLEFNTMPGWAGSSWYWLRYMDPKDEKEFASLDRLNYWQNVDLYIGGSEHATGHLLYARFWNKFLKDRNFITVEEPFKKLINQGMILGNSAFVYEIMGFGQIQIPANNLKNAELPSPIYISEKLFNKIQKYNINIQKIKFERNGIVSTYDKDGEIIDIGNDLLEILKNVNMRVFNSLHISIKEFHFNLDRIRNIRIPIEFVNENYNSLNLKSLKSNWFGFKKYSLFIPSEDGNFYVHREVEKMSKSKYNVINPDEVSDQYGADCLRMYEMFLGPLEQSKPWNTQGLSGVSSFLKKFWRLFFQDSVQENGKVDTHSVVSISEEEPSGEEWKILHQTIKKVQEDLENFSFNTSVSTFMIATNELTALKSNKRKILEPLVVLISPYAPHLAEELWQQLGHNVSVSQAEFPQFDPKYLVENEKEYPVSFNGKMRFTQSFALDKPKEEIEKEILADERSQKYLEGKPIKKFILVPGKIINVVF